MTAANNKLRAARERTASPTNPDECLSRQELAELVNAWVWEHHDKTVVLATANYLGKLETGIIRWPGKFYREAFRAILGVSKDSDLGFVNARSRRAAVKLEAVDRQQLIRSSAALGVGRLVQGPVAALLEGIAPAPIATRVGATEIEQTRTAKQVFQSWSLTYGGGVARDAVRGQLRWSAGLLEAACPDRLRPELLSAVGDLATTAGAMALDAGAQEEARRIMSFALGCAEEAKDWHLRAEVLSDMAVQAIRTGQPDEGLTLAEQALVRADRLTATMLAMLHTVRGRALATMRRVQETLSAIGTADEHFAHSTPDNDPLFMAFYNATIYAGHTGHRLADLAILGHDPGEATDRLTAAVAGHTTGHARPRALDLAKLATLTMATGDPLQAVTIGHQALETAGTLRSRFAAEGLRELSRHAAAHQNLEEVAHLRHRIGTLLVRTDSP